MNISKIANLQYSVLVYILFSYHSALSLDCDTSYDRSERAGCVKTIPRDGSYDYLAAIGKGNSFLIAIPFQHLNV